MYYIYRERERQTDRQTDKETETDRQRHRERAACTWRLRYHATVNPPLNCLQLVDILHRVQIPDRACELQRWPNQGFVCLLLDGHGVHLPVPPQEPVLLALLVILVVCKSQRRSQRRSSESVTPRHLVSLVNLRGWPRLTPSTGLRHPSLDEHAESDARSVGMAMKVVLMVKRVPLCKVSLPLWLAIRPRCTDQLQGQCLCHCGLPLVPAALTRAAK